MRIKTQRTIWAYTFISPNILCFIVFLLIPVLLSFVIAFKDFRALKGIWNSPWVGFSNFVYIFGDYVFWKALVNTVIFTFIMVPQTVLMSLILASLIYPISLKAQSFFRAAYYLPGLISAVIISIIWKWMYDPTWGLFNFLLNQIGIPSQPWLTSSSTSLFSIILSCMLYAPGAGIILYLAALARVPQSITEASIIDGASPMQRWLHVMIPLVKPTTLYLVVMNTIYSFQVFTNIYIMTGGGPGHSSTTLVYHIYDLAFKQGKFGPASAVALVLFVLVSFFAFFQFKYLQSDVEY